MQPDRRTHHHLLHFGYGLLAAVLVLMALAVNDSIDRQKLHRKATALDHRVVALKASQTAAERNLQNQSRENMQQDKGLKAQHVRIQKQEQAISRLSHLRQQDSRALTGLRNELAARYNDNARVKKRLQQLEANNAEARTVISTTPAATKGEGRR